jgi:hypothetical protein
MEQLTLVEKDPPPLPEALSAEEMAESERLDAAVAAEQRRQEENMERYRREQAAGLAAAEADSRSRLPDATLAHEPAARGESASQTEPASHDEITLASDAGPARQAGPTVLNLHKVHNGSGQNSAATSAAPCTCAAQTASEKNVEEACIEIEHDLADDTPDVSRVRSKHAVRNGKPQREKTNGTTPALPMPALVDALEPPRSSMTNFGAPPAKV